MRKVARMLIEQTIGGASEGARAAILTEAKEYIDIALQHALDKDWSKRKLESLLAMYRPRWLRYKTWKSKTLALRRRSRSDPSFRSSEWGSQNE